MIALFVIKLTAGITLMWLLMPRRDVTDGFFRIQMRLVLGLVVLGALMLSKAGTWEPKELAEQASTVQGWLQALEIFAGCVAYPGSIFWALGRRLPGGISIWLLAAACNAALIVHSVNIPTNCHVLLQVASDGVSAVLLGAMLTGMLLGHWYLTTPGMSIRPLRWFPRALFAAGGARLVVSSLIVTTYGLPPLDLSSGIWFGVRQLCGIVIPIAVAVAVLKILDYRNTQSATGVLFAGLILVFMGEMMAALLERATQIPF